MENENLNERSDAELVALALAGSKRAFGELLWRDKKAIESNARAHGSTHEDAEDLFQEVAILVYERLAGLREPAKFEGWRKAIARHRLVDGWRCPRLRSVGMAEALEPACRRPGPTEAAVWSELLAWTQTLAEPHRTVGLCLAQGMETGEIAEFLGRKYGSVGRWVLEFRRKARTFWGIGPG